MEMIFGKIFWYILTICLSLFILAFAYLIWTFNYWKRKKIPYIPPPLPFGNINPLNLKKCFSETFQDYYMTFKSKGQKHGGITVLYTPIYFPVDPQYISNILVKDFQYFNSRGVYYNERDDPLSAHLFSLEGQKWKNLRAKLTPTYTASKIKSMFKTIMSCTSPMEEYLDQFATQNEPCDLHQLTTFFTMDTLGHCSYGLDCNTFKSPNSPLVKIGSTAFRPSKTHMLKGFFCLNFQSISRALGLKFVEKNLAEFFTKMIKDTVESREKSTIQRKDFMQVLINLKNAGDPDLGRLTMEEISAHAFLVFLAGFDTTATTLMFCLFELAYNEIIQNSAREEVQRVLGMHEREISYEAIMEMKYLDQVLEETLRKYPAVSILNRQCTQDYKIPGTELTLENGTPVVVPVFAIHYDPEHYPEPYKFDPRRFSDEEKKKRMPFVYLPFGEGPRFCLGYRFALTEMKVALSVILKRYRITLKDNVKYPIVFNPNSLVLGPKEQLNVFLELID